MRRFRVQWDVKSPVGRCRPASPVLVTQQNQKLLALCANQVAGQFNNIAIHQNLAAPEARMGIPAERIPRRTRKNSQVPRAHKGMRIVEVQLNPASCARCRERARLTDISSRRYIFQSQCNAERRSHDRRNRKHWRRHELCFCVTMSNLDVIRITSGHLRKPCRRPR